MILTSHPSSRSVTRTVLNVLDETFEIHSLHHHTHCGQAAVIAIAYVCAMAIVQFLFEGLVCDSSFHLLWCQCTLTVDGQNCQQVASNRAKGHLTLIEMLSLVLLLVLQPCVIS
jgi:hypothetical protein